jgi:nucleoside-diphosphate-sugar epimerase
MKVFVLGGTGAMGSHTVPVLVAAGHRVAALARSPSKAEVLTGQGAAPVMVSIFDRAGLTEAFAGHDAIVNLASSLPSNAAFPFRSAWRANTRIRTEGSANVVAAALAAGVGRVIQESVSMLYPESGYRWLDETSPTTDVPAHASAGNHAAEANVERFRQAGGTGVVLRFGLFLGPGAAHSELFVRLARRHVVPLLGRPDSYLSSIHLDDGATATEAALRVPSGTYNVVDDEPLTKRAYAAALADAVGTRPWIKGPGRLPRLLGHRVDTLMRSMRVSNRRFREVSGWAPAHPSDGRRRAVDTTARALTRMPMLVNGRSSSSRGRPPTWAITCRRRRGAATGRWR